MTAETDRSAALLLRHYIFSRGRSVLKTGGTYRTVDNPTDAQLAACDTVLWPDGTIRPEYYLGGHVTEVTAAQAAALTAAGYVVT